jgi:23S rRNA U2552 (ribose-2'-O)-methylase RlmE/FtsJ
MIVDTSKLSETLTPLCEIMINQGSDKGGSWHNYTLVYSELFNGIKSKARNVFELGIGTINSGASIKGWKEYFKKAKIYGADIDENLLFQEERIKTFYCDQTSPETIAQLWSNFENIEFDFILEDGLHEYNANICFLENSLHKVKKGGFYVIEDIVVNNIRHYLNYFENCTLDFDEYQIIDLDNPVNKQDNVLIIIKK